MGKRSATKQDTVKIIRPDKGGNGGLIALVAGLFAALVASSLTKVVDRKGENKREEIWRKTEEGKMVRPPTGPFDYLAAGVGPGGEGSPKGRIITFAKKHNWRWLGRLLQVLGRYGELQGSNLAGAVTLQMFIALFPLLIIASAVAGFFVANSGDDVTDQIMEALGITSGTARDTINDALSSANDGKGWAAVIGFVSLLWSSLGISAALQFAYNQTWQAHGRGIKDKAVGLGWMLGAAILFVGSAALVFIVGLLPGFFLSALSIAISLALTFCLWMFTSYILPNVKIPLRSLVPGAIVGTLGLLILQVLAREIPGLVGGSNSAAFGAFGVALALIAALLLFGKIVVYGAVTNVILYEAKYGTTKATIELPGPAISAHAGVTRAGQRDDRAAEDK